MLFCVGGWLYTYIMLADSCAFKGIAITGVAYSSESDQSYIL